MRSLYFLTCFGILVLVFSCGNHKSGQSYIHDTILLSDTIQYHPVRINLADHSILPWFSADPGESYDTVLMLVWNFWKNMEIDSNGLKYYMNHQVWSPEHDMRGLGGDQFSMALSSWSLLYAYTGDYAIVENMKYLADTYLERSLSDSTDQWPLLPYPYNTTIHSGKYDGDMRNGKGYLQPDKAGNFGYELINLYKITGDSQYLKAAGRMGKILAQRVKKGDQDHSPLPFRVNAKTGKPGFFFDRNPGEDFFDNSLSHEKVIQAVYTANWTGTLLLLEALEQFDRPNAGIYQKAFQTLLEWMKKYPLMTNKWGPFFEDIPGWSDTQTNAITFAMFMLQHPDFFPEWRSEVKGILEWTYAELGNHEYEKYNVLVMNEQTVYRVPGNSHSSRQASVELMYAAMSGDSSYTANAIHVLNWATYTVAADGRNRYIRDDIWLTDGYGDYVRHYLRAMAAMPELAPAGRNRLLASSSVVQAIHYAGNSINYKTYDESATETFRLMKKPETVSVDKAKLPEISSSANAGWIWKPLGRGGILKIHREQGKEVTITFP